MEAHAFLKPNRDHNGKTSVFRHSCGKEEVCCFDCLSNWVCVTSQIDTSANEEACHSLRADGQMGSDFGDRR
jgi:hypothetical protein